MAPERPRFTPETLRFLRGLKRNNRRDWFNARRDVYETHIRQPMTAIVERLAVDLRSFAPEFVASPKVSMFRIHRDTRFSADKRPYKTHIAAVFPARGLPRHEGPALYFHVSAEEIWIGGGLYAPPTPQLQAVREHVAADFKRLRTILESPAFKRTFGALEDTNRLQRVPRGFPRDHPAAEYLKYRTFIAGAEFPPTLAATARFYPALIDVFRRVTPLTRFLGEPLRASAKIS